MEIKKILEKKLGKTVRVTFTGHAWDSNPMTNGRSLEVTVSGPNKKIGKTAVDLDFGITDLEIAVQGELLANQIDAAIAAEKKKKSTK